MPTMRRQLLAALGLGLAARHAAAQCTLPSPPENTQFVQPPGGTPDCGEGEVIANGESCDVACAAGYGQGGGGSYTMSCTGGTLGPVSPECSICSVTEYNDEPGGPCLSCPDHSETGVPGAVLVNECDCQPGYFGTITTTDDECTICPENEYTAVAGAARCEECPANSITEEEGSTSVADCLCDAGFYDAVAGPRVVCETCPTGTDCRGGATLVDGADPATAWRSIMFLRSSAMCSIWLATDPGTRSPRSPASIDFASVFSGWPCWKPKLEK